MPYSEFKSVKKFSCLEAKKAKANESRNIRKIAHDQYYIQLWNEKWKKLSSRRVPKRNDQKI